MNPTKFSGPILYSARSKEDSSIASVPISLNPDYVTYMDDFQGKIVDTNTMWTTNDANGGSVGIWPTAIDTTPIDDNLPDGWALIQSDNSNSFLLDSGSTITSYAVTQPAFRGKSYYYESRVAISNPKNCDFFFGITIPYQVPSFDLSTSTTRVGFQLSSSAGTGKLECVAAQGVNNYLIHTTDFDFPNSPTIYLSESSGDSGNSGDISVSTAPVLSIRIINNMERTGPLKTQPDEQDTYLIQYYVNRKLIHTIQGRPSVSGRNFLSTYFYSVLNYYEKKSERSGITLQTDMDATTSDVAVLIDVPGMSSSNGCGFAHPQKIKIGNEVMQIYNQVPGFREGSKAYVRLIRDQVSPEAHSIGDAVEKISEICAVDYFAWSFPRYPTYNRRTPFMDYLIDTSGKLT